MAGTMKFSKDSHASFPINGRMRKRITGENIHRWPLMRSIISFANCFTFFLPLNTRISTSEGGMPIGAVDAASMIFFITASSTALSLELRTLRLPIINAFN